MGCDYKVDKETWENEDEVTINVYDYYTGEFIDRLKISTEALADGRFDLEIEGAKPR